MVNMLNRSKSKELVDYYLKNPKEKELIIEQIREAQAKLNKYAIRMYDDIPDYLMPQFISNFLYLETQLKLKP